MPVFIERNRIFQILSRGFRLYAVLGGIKSLRDANNFVSVKALVMMGWATD
jgi:hypothetical protein